ncbi:Uncharacterised protein [Mycobacteroides abscessus subsp. massiliense]|nr:Uncharacterised protein [Mycobacteroides abscessus subsp. massiliense]
MILEHQGEFVGDHEQRGDGGQIVTGRDRILVFADRVEGTALYIAAGLLEQVLAPGNLATQRVGETIRQRALLGHVRDHGDDLWEVAEDIGSRFTLEVRVDHDETVGRMRCQQ